MGRETYLPHEYIDALICGYASADRARKVLVMLQIYLDDSESNIEDKWFVLAGYLGAASDWSAFANDWDQALRESPALHALHMTKSFYDFSEEERHAKLLRLARVVRKFDLTSFSCSVNAKCFNEVLKPVVVPPMTHPFFIAFYWTFSFVLHVLRVTKPEQGTIDFIFDEKPGIGQKVFSLWPVYTQGLPKWAKDRLSGPPIFRDDEKITPLQASDMLAWHVRKSKEASTYNDMDSEVLNAMVHQHHDFVWGEEALGEFHSHITRKSYGGLASLPAKELRKVMIKFLESL